MKAIAFNAPLNLAEEEKWFIAVTICEATNCVFEKNDENSCFSINTPSHWIPDDGEETIGRLNNFLELRSQDDIELHFKQSAKKGLGFKMFETNS